MPVTARFLCALLMLLACTASVPRHRMSDLSAATIAASIYPYAPGSRIVIRTDGIEPPYQLSLSGPGRLHGAELAIPSDALPSTTTLFVANHDAMAVRNLRIGAPPPPGRSFLAVASYDDGIVFHRDDAAFAPLCVLGIGGAPSDVAIDANDGRLAAADTDGTTVTIASLAPWGVQSIEGVALGDEVAIDERSHAVFVTNRDLNGAGALTRIDSAGRISQTITGDTAEGLAIDERRRLVYVANVNAGTISIVEADTMRMRGSFPAVPRVFSLALSPDGRHLFAVSNQSFGSPFNQAGSVVAFDVAGSRPRRIARSAPLAFPLGVAYDGAQRRLFVTDERDAIVDVLDPRTLRAAHAPLRTCDVPWLPAYDETTKRLYVPCSRSNEVDVFDTRTLARLPGAPFATGGYPLAIAVWHPAASSKR